jgi:hypothetical protein
LTSDSEEDEEESAGSDVDEIGLDGTTWTRLSDKPTQTGRAASHNVFRVQAGLTGYSRSVSTPLEAWRLLIDKGLLRHIWGTM